MTQENLQDSIDWELRQSAKTPQDCMLCGQRAGMRGVFIPAASFAATIGKQFVVYPICESCQSDPFAAVRCEAIWMQRAIAEQN